MESYELRSRASQPVQLRLHLRQLDSYQGMALAMPGATQISRGFSPRRIALRSEYRTGMDIPAAKAGPKARVSLGTPEGVP
jgi:hypothetical protein